MLGSRIFDENDRLVELRILINRKGQATIRGSLVGPLILLASFGSAFLLSLLMWVTDLCEFLAI